MKKLLVLLAATAFALLGLAAPASAAATDTTTIWVGLGSGHLYKGTFDACTGALSATGTTNGATGTYAETLTGQYEKATGKLTFTSVYGMDDHGVVDDSSGVNNSAYSYTLTGTVVANWVTGSFTISKTPVGGTSVTSAASPFDGHSVWFEVSDNGAACPPAPVLDGGNHGQCVSTKAKTLSGKALAAVAKDDRLIGYDCHRAA